MQDKDTLYARWLNGEIESEELEALRKDGVLDDLNRIVRITEEWTMPSYDIESGYEKYISRYTEKKRKINWRYVTGIAASFLLIISLGIYFLNNQGETIHAKPGMTEMVQLEDGTNIQVNDGSEINYKFDKWESERRVQLIGEAYFEVEEGALFEVWTGNGSVTVLGTKFNVRAWGNNLYVECYEGRVQINTNKQEMIVNNNESINIVGGSMKEKQSIDNASPLWMDNKSRFFEESLQLVFAEIERQFNVSVQAPLINRRFSGIFVHNSLEEALYNVCKPSGLSYKVLDNVVLIE